MPSRALSRVLSIIFAGTACGGDGGQPSEPAPPAEFLVAAGDSTFWVHSGADGVRMRGSPILLTRLDGRFNEIYVVDDDRSFYDAVLVGQRLYRRDLLTGDSTLVLEDTLVPALARRYQAMHPTERALGPDEEASEEPSLTATAEIHILGIMGPYLSFEYRADLHGTSDPDPHATWRGVVDLRDGKRATLDALFGARERARIVAAGRARLRQALDSILATGDPEAQRAAETAAELEIDPLSFALVEAERGPAVAFLARARRGANAGAALPLPPIPAEPGSWWTEEDRVQFPMVGPDSVEVVWPRESYSVVVRADSAQEALTLAIRDSAGHEWLAGRIPMPLDQLYWLDTPPVDTLARRALARAFDEAALYREETRIVTRPLAPALRRASMPAPGSRSPAPTPVRPVAGESLRGSGISSAGPSALSSAGPSVPSSANPSPLPARRPAAHGRAS